MESGGVGYLYLERKADVGVSEGEHIGGDDKSFQRHRYSECDE